MEAVTTRHNEIKIKRYWDYQVSDAVVNNLISTRGIRSYWAGIDEDVDFWENGKKSGHKNNQQHGSRDNHQKEKKNPQHRETFKWAKNKSLDRKSPYSKQ